MDRWEDQAICKGIDIELFFPDRGRPSAQVEMIKEICRQCPVRRECLTEHLHEEYGIFGGTTARQRRRIIYQMRRAKKIA